MGAPKTILKLIQGYRIPFFQKPPLVFPKNIKVPLLTKYSEEMSAIVQKMKKQDLQKVIGILNFASFVIPRGRLNHRQLLIFLNSLPSQSLKNYLLPQNVKNELDWWINNCHKTTPLHHPSPTNFLATDASDLAWGAQLDDHSVWGSWSTEEQKLHCNQKELLAILYAIQSHVQLLKSCSVLIQCDSKTAVAYLRNEGGTKSLSLLNITYQILQIANQNQIHYNIYHIPGKYNSQADHLSRHRQLPEWHLQSPCVEKVICKWGTPVIDLFASKKAHVVNNYVSRDLKDQQALFHNAFSIQWDFSLAWVFPPPFLVPKVLTHLNQAKGIFLLVVPRWKKVYWRADI